MILPVWGTAAAVSKYEYTRLRLYKGEVLTSYFFTRYFQQLSDF